MSSDRRRRIATVLVLALLVVSGAIISVALTSFTSDPANVDGEIPLGAPDGPTVTLVTDGSTQVNLEDAWQDNETLYLETEAGNMTVSGDPGANATIHVSDITGTETVASNISGGADWLELDPEDKQRVDVRGDVDTLRFQAIGVDDGSYDLEIGGTSGGTADLRLYDLPSNESIALLDPDSGETLATGETDSSGTVATTADLTSSTQQLEVRTVDDVSAPTVSNPTPEGKVTEIPDQLSVDVTAEAYPATVTFTLEGETVGTVETNSDGTVSTGIDINDLGVYEWSATVEDGAGQTDSLSTSFETPRNLTIREEHAPETIVNDTTVTIRFFTADGDIAIERQTSDGTLDMDGLPNSDFVAFLESSNHYDRRVYIGSIFEQEDVFLLNETQYPRGENEAIRSRFTYTDLTGQYPRADTTLQVQRSIDLDGDGTSEWRTVAGDFWGAGGEFEVILEHGARYRLLVTNQETGDTDVVGTHIPTEDLTHEIRTSGLTQEAENASGVFADAQLDEDDGLIEIVYDDPAERTEELRVRVVSRGGNETIYNRTISGPLGSWRDTVALNDTQLEEDWVVEIQSGRHSAAIPVGSGSVGLPVDVPGWLMTVLMSMTVTFVGALYGPRTATLGAWAMVFVASGVAMFGWAFGWPSIVAATLIATGTTFYAKVFP